MVTLALVALVFALALSIAVVVIVGLLQPAFEPVVVAPLRWYS